MNKRLVRNHKKENSDYDPEFHDKMAFEFLSKGKAVVELLAKLHIVKSTYYDWIETKPSFKRAIELGRTNGEALWVSRAADKTFDPDFKEAAFKSLMARQYSHPSNRERLLRVNIEADTAVESFKKIMSAVSNEMLTTKEALDLSHILLASVTAKEREELEVRISELEAIAASQ